MDHPFVATLTRSGPVGQALLAGLIGLSIFTWAIIVSKSGALRRAERSARAFLARFRQSGVEWMSERHPPRNPGDSTRENLRRRTARASLAARDRSRDVSFLHQARGRVQSALETEIVEQINELEKGQISLAIGASAGPLLGLLGTVWGIMNAFVSMGMYGNAGIAAVAPGVAEALVRTVAGLAVAIPSVIAYNVHSRKIQSLTTLFDRFSNEFVTTLDLAGRTRGASRSNRASKLPESGILRCSRAIEHERETAA